MRYVTDAVQMKEIDRRTSENIGIAPIVLMEKAAERIAECAVQMLGGKEHSKGKRVLAVYGAGGNGGDAAAAARLLHLQGVQAELFAADRKTPCDLTKTELDVAKKCGVPEQDETCNDVDFSAYSMIIDGIFGIGLSRNVEGKYQALIERINASGTPVLSVDIPSGIHAGTGECLGTAIRAECTVTFGEYKIGHFLYPGTLYCGKLVLGDAGFVPQVTREVLRESDFCCMTYEASDAAVLLPERTARSHKGSYGRVLIYAGSKEVTGAAYLAAKAAYRCGVGLVKLVSEKECIDTVRQMLPEALYETLPEENLEQFWKNAVSWADAVLAGCGIGTGKAAKEALLCLSAEVKTQKKALVLDADALNLFAGILDENRKVEQENDVKAMQKRMHALAEILPEYTVLTPHPKEFSRLSGYSVKQITEHFIDTAKQCIYNNKLIYVLKDARTLVACEKEIYINRSGCDGMATGGSGDVLAGIIAGLCASKNAWEAAKAGVFLHGLAGERAQKKCGCFAMLAGDILDGMLLPED